MCCIQIIDSQNSDGDVGSMEVSGDSVATADGVACDVSTSCDGGVDIRVAMGGGDMSSVATAKGRTKKSPQNNKKKAGEIYTINLNTVMPELWGRH